MWFIITLLLIAVLLAGVWKLILPIFGVGLLGGLMVLLCFVVLIIMFVIGFSIPALIVFILIAACYGVYKMVTR